MNVEHDHVICLPKALSDDTTAASTLLLCCSYVASSRAPKSTHASTFPQLLDASINPPFLSCWLLQCPRHIGP